MLKYSDLINIAIEITNNDKIPKNGLIINYILNEEQHIKLDEDLFYRTNQHKKGKTFKHQDIIEVTIDQINFKITYE